MTTETVPLPQVRIRGRSFIALVVAPEPPLELWLRALDHQMARSAGFFANRPVIADLAALAKAGAGQDAVLNALNALKALESRNLPVIGVEGVDPGLLAGTRWERLANLVQAHDARREGRQDRVIEPPPDAPADAEAQAAKAAPEPAAPAPAPEPAPPSLLIDRPVRSGQSILFEEGDVIVVGSVASGAEVIAGGSIHVYGALRGRAIAGIRTGPEARIFCRKMEAELVAIDSVYKTAEHWGEGLHGRAVHICRDRGVLRLSALD